MKGNVRQAGCDSDDDTINAKDSQRLDGYIQDAYIVAAVRTPVGKAPRGMFKTVRPDDMLAHVLKAAMAQCPGLDPAAIDDVIPAAPCRRRNKA